MSNIRINKIALELNVQNDQIIEELQKKNIMVKNYMSAIDDEAANYIRTIFSKPQKSETKKAAAKSKKIIKTSAAKAKAKTAKTTVKKKAVAKKTATVKNKAAVKTKAKKATTTAKKAATKTTTAKKAAAVKKTVAKTTPAKKDVKKTPIIGAEALEPKKNTAVEAAPLTDKEKPGTQETKAPKKLGLKIVKKEEKPKTKKAKAPPPKPEQKPEPAKSKPAAAKEEPAEAPQPVAPLPPEEEEEKFEKVSLYDAMSLRDLAEALKCSPNDIIRDLISFGVMATINQTLDVDLASKVADKMGFEVEVAIPELELFEEDEVDNKEDQKLRPPIVTIMGHVDHGKTSLLDVIRETSVTKAEHGGITQHIGAYQAKIKDQLITFLDTPGHEAFTAMRARGAQITDIVVLVVAADDGMKPQTLEAIDHAKAANIEIMVAINKIDKHDAKPDEVRKQLAGHGLLPEEWGGQTIFTEVSALKKIGIAELLEILMLQAEVLECKSNPNLMAKGVVIESKLDKGRGPVATIMVENGTLRVGEPFIVGCYFGRVRAMVNHKGKKIMQAGASTPVEVLGIPEVPQPGDKFMVVRDEKRARQLSSSRIQKQRESNLAKSERITLEDLHQQITEGEIKELNLIVKADVQGSIQAVKEAFSKLETNEVRIKVIHEAVGGITESDVLLASASNALIIGFNVRLTEKANPLATREKVDVRLYNVIYDAIDEMKKAMDGMLAPKCKEKIVGRAEVRQVFTIPKAGVIAGCSVLSGYMERNLNARLIRDDVVVYQGKLHSLRRFKEDVKTVQSGYECGIALDKYQDIKLGDMIEPYMVEEVER
ncbi:MAG: translation initiation factor IF-2 [Nitrospinota bacterium]|nr:translation initiation factor IF-2 [Nitrospinota bacterium]